MKDFNMMLMSDFYKQGHPEFYPDGLDYLFTCGTPRMSRLNGINEVVAFGYQAFAKDYLIERFNETFFNRPKDEAVQEVVDFLSDTFDCSSFDVKRIEELHDLGYLPVRMWAIPEGTMVPIINQKENPGVPQVPFMAYESTHPKFAWVAEFLESITSAQVWYPMVIATVAKKGYRDIVNKHWEKSVVGQPAHTAVSEFGFRGAEGSEGAIMASSAFLTSFDKTATVPAIGYVKKYYGEGMTRKEIGTGMSSTEHSVMCSNYAVDGNEDDFMLKLFTEIAPNGNVSCVADSYDYFGRLAEMGRDGSKIKEAIMNRNGCVYVRGDSGNPAEIICGTLSNFVDMTGHTLDEIKEYARNTAEKAHKPGVYETHVHVRCGKVLYSIVAYHEYIVDVDDEYGCGYYSENVEELSVSEKEITPEMLGTVEMLWEAFGGTVNEKGYKILDSHVRAIYGDSITPMLADEIYSRLEKKGFAANNVALGAGSFSLQAWEERSDFGRKELKPHTRDTFGIAFKATYCEVNGKPYQVFKNPKTDAGSFKKSQRGMVIVIKDNNGKLSAIDGLTREQFNYMKNQNVMRPIFENSKMLVNESMKDIRERLHSNQF